MDSWSPNLQNIQGLGFARICTQTKTSTAMVDSKASTKGLTGFLTAAECGLDA
jgi:hypothetical protein